MTHASDARRDTPLALALKERIRREGPITVEAYFDACLNDPQNGYYRTRQAIGRRGDFTTAPEISQVFGELIGLWCAVVWQQMGSPRPFDLIEVGPGQGSLMADALRALRALPVCLQAVRVRMIEVNPVLRRVQQERLAGSSVEISWHDAIAGAEKDASPAIIIANELIDTQPVRQIVVSDRGTYHRCVMLDESGNLQFGIDAPDGPCLESKGDPISEVRPLHPLITEGIGTSPRAAALLIDYGHGRAGHGDTLQAVRSHRYEHPLCSPGEADLSAQVDFATLADQVRAAGLAADGPVTQGEFLGALGIVERASRLMGANPSLAGEIEMGVARIMSPTGMGTRFKAIGVRHPQLPPLPGLDAG